MKTDAEIREIFSKIELLPRSRGEIGPFSWFLIGFRMAEKEANSTDKTNHAIATSKL